MYGEIGAEQLDLDHRRSGSRGRPDPAVSGHRDRVDTLDDDIQPESELLGGDLMSDGVTDRSYGMDERGPRNNRLFNSVHPQIRRCCVLRQGAGDRRLSGGRQAADNCQDRCHPPILSSSNQALDRPELRQTQSPGERRITREFSV
jgi:hypothetical protein